MNDFTVVILLIPLYTVVQSNPIQLICSTHVLIFFICDRKRISKTINNSLFKVTVSCPGFCDKLILNFTTVMWD